MALIKCPECGKEVSDKANVCLNCGYSIREYVENIRKKEVYQKRIDSIKIPEKPKRENSWFIFMGICIIGALSGIISESDNDFTIFLYSFTLFFGVVFSIGVREYNYRVRMKKYKLAIDNPELYRITILQEQEEKDKKLIKCPNCGSANTKKISATSRVVSTTMIGLASSKLGKQFECKNCGYKW